MEIETALVHMVQNARIMPNQGPPFAGRAIHYDDTAPSVTAAQPVYAVVRVQTQQRGYAMSTGPTSRISVDWGLTVIGLVDSVREMLDLLPGALTGHYLHRPETGDPVLVLGAFVQSIDAVTRSEAPNATAEGRILLSSEIIPG